MALACGIFGVSWFVYLRCERHLGCRSKFLPLIDILCSFNLWSIVQLFRSLFGFAFPLFAEQMFAKLGLGGILYVFFKNNLLNVFHLNHFFYTRQLLAGLAIVLGIPFPIWIYYKGEEMRARNPMTRASTISKKKKTRNLELRDVFGWMVFLISYLPHIY